MNHTPHDSFFGETFSIQAIALESMQMVLTASVLEELDLDNMKLEESKFQADDKNLIADVIWSIPLKKGQKEMVDVVIFYEHKSTKPQDAILQLLGYMTQFWTRQKKQGKPFSLIIPIVLYMGKSRWKPKQFDEMFPARARGIKAVFVDF